MAGKNTEDRTLEKVNQRLERDNRVLKAIRNINRLIVKTKDRDALLKGACEGLTETRGYYNAWIALLDDDRKLIAGYESGLGDDFLPIVDMLETGNLPHCVHEVLDSECIFSVLEPPTSCTDCPLAPSYSGRAGIAANLQHDGKVYGVMVISTPIEYAQDTEEQDLLGELAADLGYALSTLKQENSLVESEDLLRQSQRIAQVGSWILDVSTGSLTWSDEVFRIFGYLPQAFTPTYAAVIESIHPDDRAGVDEAYLNSVESKSDDYEIEHRIIRPNTGEIRVVHEKCTHIKDQNGNVVRSIGMVQDITERKHREEELRSSNLGILKSKALLDATGRMAKVGGWELDVVTNELTWTEETYRIHDLAVDSNPDVAKAIDFYHPEDQPIIEKAVQEALEAGRPFDLELRITSAKGRELVVRAMCTPILEGGKVVTLSGTFQDITDRKRDELELRRRLDYEKVLAKVSSELAGLNVATVDQAINNTLSILSEFTKSDRAYIYQFKNDLSHMDNTHEYCVKGIEPQVDALKNIFLAGGLPWFTKRIKEGEPLYIPDVTALPKDARREREHFEAQGIKSLVVVPINTLNNSAGFLGLDAVQHHRGWDDDDKSLLHYCSQTLSHVIEWQQAESELRRRNFIFSQTFEQSSTSTCFYNPDGAIIRVNKVFCEMFGVKKQDIENANYNIFKDQAIIDAGVMPIIREIFEAKKTKQWEFDFELAKAASSTNTPISKSENIFLEIYGYPVLSDNGELEFVVFKLYDITERKAAEKNLVALERRNQALLDHSPLSHKIVDLDFNLQYMNASGFKMFQMEETDECYGKPYPFDSFPQASRDHLTSELQKVAETQKAVAFEDISCDVGGNPVCLYHTLIPVLDEDGSLDYFTIVSADITEKKKVQERLLHSEKMDAIGQLAGGVAHDFNNQLSGVLGYGCLLTEQLDDPSLRQYAENICNAARRSADLTQKLLAFSRRGQFQHIPIEVHNVVQETVDMLKHSIDKRIRIRQVLSAQDSTVSGDPTQIQNALLNLALNARDAMPDGGTLTFETEGINIDGTSTTSTGFDVQEGWYIVISVKDTGGGIPDNVLPHIFEPFYTTKEQGKGTGMGLASVYGTAKHHKGDIAVNSIEGKGSTFKLCLPINVHDETGSLKPQDSAVVAKSLRILIVDDEEFIRELGYDMLSAAGHSVLTAPDGQQAVSVYREKWQEIDVVVLDMIMPKMGGHDTFCKMKKINPAVNAILLSGYSLNEESQAILAEGVLGFIQKPFTQKALNRAILKAASGDGPF